MRLPVINNWLFLLFSHSINSGAASTQPDPAGLKVPATHPECWPPKALPL